MWKFVRIFLEVKSLICCLMLKLCKMLYVVVRFFWKGMFIELENLGGVVLVLFFFLFIVIKFG